MVNEGAIQIEDVNNSNQEKKNNAKNENIPEEFTEKFVVKKGKGTPLKDICDVVSQLENKVFSFSTTLHCILYGEHDEVEDFKKDVLEFSGFVSDGDEESQRDKVKERLERCPRDMLTQLCSVFGITSTNAFYGKNKKELIELLLDFLEAPHDAATEETEISHREKELSSEMDTGTSLDIVHEEENKEEDDNAPSNETEEMKGSDKEENSTVFEKPKDRDVNLSKDILDISANSSRGYPTFGLNSHSSNQMLTKSVWDLEKSNKKQKCTEKKNNAKNENILEEFTEKFVVKKGKGTPLKDICDVVSQLENKVFSFSTTLHCILYGEHDEVEDFKKGVLEFSGFVSDGDEESQRDKVKERLERCPRDMLTQLCSVFGITSTNAFHGKNKKELIELLLDFLEAPHDAATEETESSHREELSSEMDTGTSLDIVHEEENKKEDSNAPSNETEEMKGSDKEENCTVFEKPKDRDVNLSKDILDISANSSRGYPTFGLNSHSSNQMLTKSVWDLEKSNKKQKHTERKVAQGGDKPPKEWCDPSCEEVQKAISIILEEIDIMTATFSDVLEKLDEHFEVDISPRKGSIMVMIEEELYRLVAEAEEQENREENQEEKAEEKQDGNENNNCIQVPTGAPVQN